MARAKEWNVKDMCSRKSNAKKFTDGVKATCEETGLQALTQPLLMGYLKSQLSTLPDKRIGHNKQHSMLDAGLSAFAVFFMQLPSFLAQQQLMLQARGGCNAFSLFGLSQIPSDNRIRQLLDPISPDLLNPLFDQIFEALMARKTLEPFRHVNDTLLMALDGVHYFASNKLNCDCCSERAHRDGVVSYSHAAVAVAVVSPDNSEVISLAPEFITPQDGCSKQDCELNAAKRWLSQHGERYVQHQVTLLGDDLYAHQPFCEQVLAQHFHFIFTCKPSSHVFLYEWLKDLREPHLKTVTYLRRVGNKTCRDTYQFANQVPLRDSDDALHVNWCELITRDAQDNIVYRNAFATNHLITDKNVVDIVEAARARWKIENEHNNVLKNRGYHLTHNFGHGKQHLSKLLFTFNLLAFLFHTVLALHDTDYQYLRNALGTREYFFLCLQVLTDFMLFTSWQHLMTFMIQGLKEKHRLPINSS